MYIVAGIIVAIVVFLSVGYVKSPPNTATIISGPGKHPRVLIGKAGFKIPFLERVDRMGIGQIDIDIETEDYIPTKDFINIQVDAIAQVAVAIIGREHDIFSFTADRICKHKFCHGRTVTATAVFSQNIN